MQQVKLDKKVVPFLEAMAERLSKPRPLPPPQKRVKAVQLKYEYDKKLHRFIEKLVPAKKVHFPVRQSNDIMAANTLQLIARLCLA